MIQKKKLASFISSLLMFAAPSFAMTRDGEPIEEGEDSSVERAEEVLITLKAPLMSPLFAEMPVAVVDEEPITFGDLVRRIASIHQSVEEENAPAQQDYERLLNRVITTRLIVQEARNIGLDELPDVVNSIESVSTDLLISKLMSLKLQEVEPNPSEVAELYEKMAREFLLATVKIQQEEDALALKEQVDSGEDFGAVATRFAAEGRAEYDAGDGNYVKLKDLLPRIAQALMEMEEGSVSEIFFDAGTFTIFHVGAVRAYEDPALLEEARQKVLEPAQKKAAREYGDYLEEKHSTVDKRLLKKVDFESKNTGFLSLGKEEPVDFDELEKDERVVATTHTDPPFVVTIGSLATAVRESFHHGIETSSAGRKNLNEKKQIVLKNLLFKRTAVAEARELGLDQTPTYVDTMAEFTTSLLFDVFVKKVIAPDVTISEEEVREYFEAHIDEFSTPKMLRLNAIAFPELQDAESALAKLQKRADFQWVSANSPGQVGDDDREVFNFDGALLSVQSLPEKLRESIEDANQGDVLIYSDDKGYHHVLLVSKVFPATPRPYESVRGAVARLVFEQNLKRLTDEWSEKLKEVYETRIFVEGLGN